jgi:hypothetical protein
MAMDWPNTMYTSRCNRKKCTEEEPLGYKEGVDQEPGIKQQKGNCRRLEKGGKRLRTSLI